MSVGQIQTKIRAFFFTASIATRFYISILSFPNFSQFCFIQWITLIYYVQSRSVTFCYVQSRSVIFIQLCSICKLVSRFSIENFQLFFKREHSHLAILGFAFLHFSVSSFLQILMALFYAKVQWYYALNILTYYCLEHITMPSSKSSNEINMYFQHNFKPIIRVRLSYYYCTFEFSNLLTLSTYFDLFFYFYIYKILRLSFAYFLAQTLKLIFLLDKTSPFYRYLIIR